MKCRIVGAPQSFQIFRQNTCFLKNNRALSKFLYGILHYLISIISGHKWSTTHRVLKSHRSKMSVIYMLAWKQCAIPVITAIHHLPKCKSCHKAIVVITGRAHCFHDNIYITLILLLWDLSTLCRGSLLTTIYISTLCGFIWKCQSTIFSTKRHFFI